MPKYGNEYWNGRHKELLAYVKQNPESSRNEISRIYGWALQRFNYNIREVRKDAGLSEEQIRKAMLIDLQGLADSIAEGVHKLFSGRRYDYCGMGEFITPELDDLKQGGAVGSIAGLENFDPDIGVKLGSYARQRIRKAIDETNENGLIVHIPQKLLSRVTRLEKSCKYLFHKLEHDPNIEEITETIEIKGTGGKLIRSARKKVEKIFEIINLIKIESLDSEPVNIFELEGEIKDPGETKPYCLIPKMSREGYEGFLNGGEHSIELSPEEVGDLFGTDAHETGFSVKDQESYEPILVKNGIKASLMEEPKDPEELYISKESKKMVLEALSTLTDEREKGAIELYHFHDYVLEKIGKIMELSRQRANQIRHSALEKLEEHYKRQEFPEKEPSALKPQNMPGEGNVDL